jgi:hypothetical protein
MNQHPRFQSDIPLIDTTGANKVAESTDPMMAMAVGLETPGYDGLAAMGLAFIEEFALMGWPRERISRMFRAPQFAAAYRVYQARGDAFVEGLITQVLGPAPAAPDAQRASSPHAHDEER